MPSRYYNWKATDPNFFYDYRQGRWVRKTPYRPRVPTGTRSAPVRSYGRSTVGEIQPVVERTPVPPRSARPASLGIRSGRLSAVRSVRPSLASRLWSRVGGPWAPLLFAPEIIGAGSKLVHDIKREKKSRYKHSKDTKWVEVAKEPRMVKRGRDGIPLKTFYPSYEDFLNPKPEGAIVTGTPVVKGHGLGSHAIHTRRIHLGARTPGWARMPKPGKLLKDNYYRIILGRSDLNEDADWDTTTGNHQLHHDSSNGASPMAMISLGCAFPAVPAGTGSTGRNCFYSYFYGDGASEGQWNGINSPITRRWIGETILESATSEKIIDDGMYTPVTGIWRYTDVNLVVYARPQVSTDYTISFVKLPPSHNPERRTVEGGDFTYDSQDVLNYWMGYLRKICQNPATQVIKRHANDRGKQQARPKILYKHTVHLEEQHGDQDALKRVFLKYRLHVDGKVHWDMNQNTDTGPLAGQTGVTAATPVGDNLDNVDYDPVVTRQTRQNGYMRDWENVFVIISAGNYKDANAESVSDITDPTFSYTFMSHYDILKAHS